MLAFRALCPYLDSSRDTRLTSPALPSWCGDMRSDSSFVHLFAQLGQPIGRGRFWLLS